MASSFSILLCFLCLLIPFSDSTKISDDSVSNFISSASPEAKSLISDVISSIEQDNSDKQESSPSSSSGSKIVLSLRRIKKLTFSDVLERLVNIAELSMHRAECLKKLNEIRAGNRTNVYSKSYGEFEISLSFGTPPKKFNFIVDTGSDLVWFPCVNYDCIFCNGNLPGADPYAKPKTATFDPQKSSSSKNSSCDNTVCSYLHDKEAGETACSTDCNPGSCTESCPDYGATYGSGLSNGTLLSETLIFGDTAVPNFMVGCAKSGFNMPAPIAGFGRDKPSLPSQLKLRKFSHCFISRRFNDTSKSSSLVLHRESDSEANDEKIDGTSYTPFIENTEFPTYYYLGLEKITVGGKVVDIPNEYLSLNSGSNGGAIIDSGTTFTYMEKRIYDKVSSEIVNQVTDLKRADHVEKTSGLPLCYEVPKDAKDTSFPTVGFHFKGGAKMDLPVSNTFWFINHNETTLACLVFVSGDGSGPVHGGPSIIFGNFQQQNFYVEYDLHNNRLGFREQDCSDY